MLKSILDDIEDNQLADRRHSPLAAGTGRRREKEADSAPPVLVAPGLSRRWIAQNAVGLAHALVAGRHEELEGCRLPDVQILRTRRVCI